MKKLIYLITLFFCGCTGLVDSIINENLGHGYQYDEVGGYPVIFRDLPSYKVIPSVIISYDHNEDFIVALQVEGTLPSHVDEFDNIANINLIKKNGNYRFWIVSHQKDSIYGPLKMDEYLFLKRQMKIPQELKVKIEL